MTRLYPSDLPAFARRFRFPGGRVRGVRVRFATADELTVVVTFSARTAIQDLGTEPRPVKLRLRLVGVEEFRFQKRPTAPGGKIPDLRVGYFGDLYFVNFDAFGLAPGETPKLHDYRASDAYVAGRELWWEEVPAKGDGARPSP